MQSAVVKTNLSGNRSGAIRNIFRPNGSGPFPFVLPAVGATAARLRRAEGRQTAFWERKRGDREK
jgi:hypothetical protein